MPVLEIEEVGVNGDGVSHHEGRPWYIPFSATGDVLNVRQTESRGRGFVGEIVDIQGASSDRIKPACRHFGTCGGCNLQHISAPALSDWKQGRIRQALEKAGLETPVIHPTITSSEHSRRRVEFVASKRKKGVMIGYHLRRSHQIFDVGDCPVLTPDLLSLVKPMRHMLSKIMPRNSQARLTLTRTINGPDLLISGTLTDDLTMRETVAEFGHEAKLCRIAIFDETEKRLEVIAAAKPPLIQIGDHQVALPPGGFLQATEEGQETLISLMLEALPSDAKILDLFCGCGSFTLPASDKARSVHGIEGDESRVNALRMTVNSQMLPVSVETRDLFRRPLMPQEFLPFDTVVIDPPRAGAAAQITELAQSTIQKVIFISCNPTSFARDAKTLCDAGFNLGAITPIDQFRWSPHTELFAVLER